MTNKCKVYLQAIRPRTLTASLGPVIVGLALSGGHAIMGKLPVAFLIVICALCLQIGANLANDYFDHVNNIDGEDRIGPARATAKGNLLPPEVKTGYRVCFGLALLVGTYLVSVGGLPILLVGLASLVFAYLYTGGPYPLSYVGLGEILALIFFGPVAVWGTWFLLTGKLSILPAVIGLGPGCIAWSLMATNNMRDRKSDQKSGKVTLAVLAGEQASRFIPIIGIIASILLPLYLAYHYKTWVLLLASLAFLPFFRAWLRILYGPIDKSQNLSLASTGKYLLIYCLVLGVGLCTR